MGNGLEVVAVGGMGNRVEVVDWRIGQEGGGG